MLNSSLSWQPKREQAEDACLQQQMMIVADGWRAGGTLYRRLGLCQERLGEGEVPHAAVGEGTGAAWI